MAKSWDDLQSSPPVLKPIAVPIAGMEDEVLVHQFTWDQFKELTAKAEGAQDDGAIKVQVVSLLRGPDHVPTEEDCKNLSRIFTVSQIRDIYHKGLRLNGIGIEAIRAAEKNSERTPS